MTIRRFVKLSVVAVTTVAVLVLNPWFGVTGDDDDFRYGAPELRAAVEGTWELTITPPDGARRTLTFTLAQSSVPRQQHASGRTLVRSATACGERSLVKAAGACMDITEMPLDVTQLADDGSHRGREPGNLVVIGTEFSRGELNAQLGDLRVTAVVTPRGEIARVTTERTRGPIPSTLARLHR